LGAFVFDRPLIGGFRQVEVRAVAVDTPEQRSARDGSCVAREARDANVTDAGDGLSSGHRHSGLNFES